MKTLLDLAPYIPSPERMKEHAETALPLAYGSLQHAFVYVCATLSPHAEAAARAHAEQTALVDRILTAGLLPFGADEVAAARAHLDANIERMQESHPLFARYAELHDMRLIWLPARN